MRSDQPEANRAARVARAQPVTIAALSGPQWCAQRNDATSNAAEITPSLAAVFPSSVIAEHAGRPRRRAPWGDTGRYMDPRTCSAAASRLTRPEPDVAT
jgi:hypothetical protein